jgi:methyl-accepting chemotaxis protein
MDKVVQQNAADSEESASASEELSSQAQELTHMVAELETMVGGNGKNGSHVKYAGAYSKNKNDARPQFRKDAEEKSKKLPGKTLPSDQAIPLDADEFKDF